MFLFTDTSAFLPKTLWPKDGESEPVAAGIYLLVRYLAISDHFTLKTAIKKLVVSMNCQFIKFLLWKRLTKIGLFPKRMFLPKNALPTNGRQAIDCLALTFHSRLSQTHTYTVAKTLTNSAENNLSESLVPNQFELIHQSCGFAFCGIGREILKK